MLRAERGAAVPEFVMILVLLVPVVTTIIHLAVVAHVRTTFISAAGDGARAEALLGAPPGAAETRVRERLGSVLGDDRVDTVTVERSFSGTIPVVTVKVSGTVPALGLVGPSRKVVGSGRAVVQVAP